MESGCRARRVTGAGIEGVRQSAGGTTRSGEKLAGGRAGVVWIEVRREGRDADADADADRA